MSGRAGRGRGVRVVGYFAAGLAAAVASPPPDVLSVFLLFLAGVALFEAALFAYGLWRGRGGR